MSSPGVHPVAVSLSRNIRKLRQLQDLSLSTLASRASISRGMLIQVEQGRTNPSLGTLLRIAGALGVSLPELLEMEQPAPVRILDSEEGTVLWTGPHGGRGRMLAGSSGKNQLQVWDWRMSPGERFAALPQSRGTVEIIHLLRGTLTLRVGDETYEVSAGKTVMFHPDRPHGYANLRRTALRMIISNSEPRAESEGRKEIVDEDD